ncbi:hypothetical protein [Reyranella sp.]|jgi:hypothetical protein|uniref:hypothetical protein n=1 Tax=Reyranella sp. TaxID=1929291 RepID=UPI000BD00198|nr:hypothetical protein [Reyranella sp.]OYY37182.1 MAG: hypothetical protein B7Y57_23300 [Rhodospirillales bacterium 35-66-84]OYZ94154.1 MAG: hypothetical protein B7Y08_13535 [Rhodospirillales bacterium 24-66-33]OZB22995.1 MAG: hypothetical protein B7X63_20685 [Rhodospirillales bacterium 39-66-50]HQS17169.1 hypothetical protein [Reyranella sp.]HQT13760.1 hypothetical protein [Reyranella sp.]
MSGARGRRLDWSAFFQVVPEPHGVRIRLATADASSPAAVTAEKRVLRLIRAKLDSERFALRRSFATGPTIIDCVFESSAVADALAQEIGAEPMEEVPGWASARRLVADERALRQLLKQGAAAPREPARPNEGGATRQDAAVEAKSRLQRMSLEEQAAVLFKSMTRVS